MLASLTRITLEVDEDHVPDLGPPENYWGPHLLVVVHADRIAALTSAGRTVRPLPAAASSALLQAATGTRQEEVHPGIDYQDETVIREPTFQALMLQKRPTLPVIESGGVVLAERFLHSGTSWTIHHISGSDFALEAGGAYLTVEPSGLVAVNRTQRKEWEIFTLTKVD